ncbi:MAG: response regulator [Candidatus Abyssobacteria bacterium SURF_5]|uniref:Response regulator n=1 Tax=Abyssobacteria bacterium (strain SURF_5) TaxID=2093360 RepID=A0A3A4N3T0_ABYX5|nr:MAG: response regulator [Candidatus Abyssubacteria bacterium SURF_5]
MGAINLLIVDDEERFLATYRKLLEKRGISTSTCTNGLDALRILKESPIDVVLLDVKMPGIDGIEALRKIKEEHPDIEVILLTGHVSVESEVEGLKLGASGYLMKPISIEEMHLKVKDAFYKKQAKVKREGEPLLS